LLFRAARVLAGEVLDDPLSLAFLRHAALREVVIVPVLDHPIHDEPREREAGARALARALTDASSPAGDLRAPAA
jgi:hypothetical protein